MTDALIEYKQMIILKFLSLLSLFYIMIVCGWISFAKFPHLNTDDFCSMKTNLN